MTSLKRFRFLAAICLIATAAWGANLISLNIRVSDASTQPYVGSALEAHGTESAEDWVSRADVVATVTIWAEGNVREPRSESLAGSGIQLTGREVTALVADTVWSRPGADIVKLPRTVTFTSGGWMVDRVTGERRPFVIEKASRLEVGHHYVIALTLYPAECGDGADIPEHWGSIGSGGVVPMTGPTLGVGEVEGTTRGLDEYRSVLSERLGPAQESSVRLEVAGQGIDALVAALNRANQQKIEELDSEQPAPSCS